MHSAKSVALVIFGSLIAACSGSDYEVLPLEQPQPLPLCTDPVSIEYEVIASGLEIPWDMAFAPDGRIFLTERPGRVRVIENDRLLDEPVATLPVANEGIVGLTGITLSPEFERTGELYVAGTYSNEGASRVGRLLTRIKRAFERRASGYTDTDLQARVSVIDSSDPPASRAEVIVDRIPASSSHGTSAIRIGPDGNLYVTTGDTNQPIIAQDPDSLAGKILRYETDGTVPKDNPLPRSPVFASGLRNPQGITWTVETNQMIATDHGHIGYDELNVVSGGANFGWPIASGPVADDRFTGPLVTWQETVAPSGIAVYRNPEHAWHGDTFVGSLLGQALIRIDIRHNSDNGSPEPVCQQVLLKNEFGRVRAVHSGPDGRIYITTSNRDYRGNPTPDDDRVIALTPAP